MREKNNTKLQSCVILKHVDPGLSINPVDSLYTCTKIRNLFLPVDCKLKLFDNTVVPILLYACEVWGYGDLNLIGKVHTAFMKHILNVKKDYSHVMLYGDLGRFPLSICIKFIVNDITNNGKTYHWFENVRSILYECNLGHVWESQPFTGSRSTLLFFVERMLKTN